MGFFAVRGSRSLSEDEFKAHLALAIRLENVGTFLGAGASVCAGGKTLQIIWNGFIEKYTDSVEWFIAQKFIDKAESHAGSSVNIEDLIDKLDLADIEWRRSGKGDTSQLATHRANVRRAIVDAALLNSIFWSEPETALDSDALSSHVRLLSRLVSNRQPGQAAPWIYTVNYDLAIEWAAEALGLHLVNGFAGLHSRMFSPAAFDLGLRNTQTRGEARFGTYNVYLGKAHGSLSWRQLFDQSVVELPARAQWPELREFMEGVGEAAFPGVLIFPGAAKFVHTTGFIYGEIIRRLTEFLSRPNTCLVISGYSFNDDHINRVILSALQNPTLQIIIYIPELDRYGLIPTLPAPELDKKLEPNPMLKRLIKRQLPQVAICGYGERAWFSSMTIDLPEPALLDDAAQRARELERLLRGPVSPPQVPIKHGEAAELSAASRAGATLGEKPEGGKE